LTTRRCDAKHSILGGTTSMAEWYRICGKLRLIYIDHRKGRDVKLKAQALLKMTHGVSAKWYFVILTSLRAAWKHSYVLPCLGQSRATTAEWPTPSSKKATSIVGHLRSIIGVDNGHWFVLVAILLRGCS